MSRAVGDQSSEAQQNNIRCHEVQLLGCDNLLPVSLLMRSTVPHSGQFTRS